MEPGQGHQEQGGDETFDDGFSPAEDLDAALPPGVTLAGPVPPRSALVPVAVPEEPTRKASLWQRIAMRRRARKSAVPGLDEGDPGERLRDRLETMEGQLAAIEDSISVHFDQLEHRFTQLWEIEDALNQVVKVPEQLTDVGDRQKELARSVRALEGRVRLLAVLTLVLAGAVGALLAISF